MENIKNSLLLFVFGAIALFASCTKPAPKFTDWESMRLHKPTPDWLIDAKFGIYFHWGVYSVPAFGSEWYPRHMYLPNEPEYRYHQDTYPNMEYHDLVPLFTGEHFDAQEWAGLFKDSGAKFAGLVAEHHDGFSMWDSDVTPWNAKEMGPKRDVTGEIAQAIRAQDMKLITTFHHARNLQLYQEKYATENLKTKGQFVNSHFPYDPNGITATTDSKLRMLYGNMPKEEWYEDVWYAKLKEVIDNYSPDLLWFDSWLRPNIPDEYLQKLVSYYFNEADRKKKEVGIVTKFDLPKHVAMENYVKSRKPSIAYLPWMTDETISKSSWCYTQDLQIRPWQDILHVLIDVVSKNGIYMLNISPMADGTIPQNQRDVLLSLGEWLGKYGESIYGTHNWFTHGQGTMKESRIGYNEFLKVNYSDNDIRYTRKNNVVYATMLGVPNSERELLLEAFASQNTSKFGTIRNIELLGSSNPVEWELTNVGLKLKVSPDMPDVAANVYKITIEYYEYVVTE